MALRQRVKWTLAGWLVGIALGLAMTFALAPFIGRALAGNIGQGFAFAAMFGSWAYAGETAHRRRAAALALILWVGWVLVGTLVDRPWR